MESIEKLLNNAFDLCINILLAVIIILVGLKLIKLLEKGLRKEHKLTKLDPSVKGFVISIVSIALKILLFVVAASIVGIPTTSFITIIGSCGLAIGLAIQGGLSNLAGGVMILIFKPFKVGDYIESNSKEGTVKSITMFYTTLTTIDNKEIQIPNGNLTSSNITNYTANPERRLDLEFSVSYDTKIDKVKKIINKVIEEEELILKDKDIIVRLIRHADSSLVFTVRVWVKSENYFNVMFNLEENIKEAFDKNKIEIPYPQIDIHTKK